MFFPTGSAVHNGRPAFRDWRRRYPSSEATAVLGGGCLGPNAHALIELEVACPLATRTCSVSTSARGWSGPSRRPNSRGSLRLAHPRQPPVAPNPNSVWRPWQGLRSGQPVFHPKSAGPRKENPCVAWRRRRKSILSKLMARATSTFVCWAPKTINRGET